MKLVRQSQQLLKDLEEVRQTTVNVVKRAELAIILCRELLTKFKKIMVPYQFTSPDDEIAFFKNIKQVPLANLVYYSELKSFEIRFPKGNREAQKAYILEKIEKLNKFFVYNIDFVQYIENDKVYLDQHYFTRAFFNDFNVTHSLYYFRDPDFSTSHDLLLAKLNANKRLLPYLENRLAKLEKHPVSMENEPACTLQWTGSKTALTEIIYALREANVLNGGSASLKEIAAVMQRTFNIELGDLYKIYSEIKQRKKNRTKFLDELALRLAEKMEKDDF
jgi:hypothetical protein